MGKLLEPFRLPGTRAPPHWTLRTPLLHHCQLTQYSAGNSSVLLLCAKRSFASLRCSLVRQTFHMERRTLHVNACTWYKRTRTTAAKSVFYPSVINVFLCFYSSIFLIIFLNIYTQGEMMSQSLWSRYDRRFLGIIGYNAWS